MIRANFIRSSHTNNLPRRPDWAESTLERVLAQSGARSSVLRPNERRDKPMLAADAILGLCLACSSPHHSTAGSGGAAGSNAGIAGTAGLGGSTALGGQGGTTPSCNDLVLSAPAVGFS